MENKCPFCEGTKESLGWKCSFCNTYMCIRCINHITDIGYCPDCGEIGSEYIDSLTDLQYLIDETNEKIEDIEKQWEQKCNEKRQARIRMR
jgi:hypothetical protein